MYFDEPTDYGMLVRREKDFSLENNLSVIQCHILFDDDRGKQRLEHQKSIKGIPSFAKVFNDCNFYVNYKTKTFLTDVKETYDKYIKNISLYNNLDGDDFDWIGVMLSLINQSTTPYILIATEDRMFHRTDKEEFTRVMKDVIDNKVQYMPIGKLDHLTVGSRYSTIDKLLQPTQVHFKTCVKKYRDSGKELFLFKAQDAPVKITSFSADALYRREFLISLLENVINKFKAAFLYTKQQQKNIMQIIHIFNTLPFIVSNKEDYDYIKRITGKEPTMMESMDLDKIKEVFDE